jgi:hypothetical protein
MLVREEKILLMAKESESDTDILTAVRQVVNNCALDPNFDVDDLALFELDWLFIRLRAFSSSDTIEVSYRDNQENKVYDFKIKLDEVQIKFPDGAQADVIELTKTAGITLRYPSAKLYSDSKFLNSLDGEKSFFDLAARCIKSVYDGDSVMSASDFSHEELMEFIESIDIKSYNKIREYLTLVPSLYHRLSYVDSSGQEKEIILSSLSDFFTLR